MPIIHEPKFRKNVQEGLHRRDVYFGRLVMMMCALSSRDSNDPRVLIQGEKECSAGWKYYEQVQVMRQWMFEAPSLHELQIYSVSLAYSLAYCAQITDVSRKAGNQIFIWHFGTSEYLGFDYPWYSILS